LKSNLNLKRKEKKKEKNKEKKIEMAHGPTNPNPAHYQDSSARPN
jgi:hypothetical protein